MQPGGPPGARPLPPAYQHPSQQQQGPPGMRPAGAPGYPPGAGPYSNGVGAVRPAGGVQPLAGQMQQMKLGGGGMPAPGGAAPHPGVRPTGMPAPGLPPGAVRPVGPSQPGAAGPGLAPRPMAGPANGYHAAAPAAPTPPAGYQQQQQQQQQRPPSVPGMAPGGMQQPRPAMAQQPGMRPPGAGPMQHPTAAAGMRPPGPPGAAPTAGMARPGMPGGGLAQRPPAMGAGPVPQLGQQPPGMPGAGFAPRPPALSMPGLQSVGSGMGSGYSTPRNDADRQQQQFQQQQQQQPHGTPQPYALQVASPSPTKRSGMGAQPGGGMGGGLQPQGSLTGQQVQGLRPPMPPMGGMPGPGMQQYPQQQPQYQQQPGQGHARQQLPPGPPGMMPQQQQQQHPGMMPPMPGMPGQLPAAPGMMPGQQAGMQGMMPGQGRPPMPTVSAGGQQAPSGGSSKIDPSQIPRPMPYAIPTQVFETRRENTHAIPPATDAPIVVRDRGSAGPRFIRSTLNMLPQTADLMKGASLPLVAIISPLALQDPGDDPVELVDFGPMGPIRCSACKAYVNPYMRFTDGGRTMVCNFCGASTELPADYRCHTGPDGERRDKYERPELCKGSVEMTVTPEYQVRPPMRPTHFFLIEVSQPAVASGATAAACSSIARILDDLPGGDRTMVCVATFDSTIHFYSMRPGQAQPHMLVVPDVTDVYCPLPGNVVVNLRESRALVANLLESIPKMFAGGQVSESCGGAALKSAIEALKGGEGGRLHAFICSLPRRGTLHLRLRDVGRSPTDRDQLDSLLPENKEYLALATDAAEHQVSVDLFVMSQGYADVATLGVLCSHSAGSLFHWPAWQPQQDADEFFNDLRWTVMRPQALEAVGRLRCSRGLAVDKYIGSFYRRVDTDLNFPALACDHAFAAKLLYEEKLSERGEAYLQFALLYTTTEGQRRVRVHTLALPVTQSLGTAFRGADLDAYLSYVSRKVASQVPGHALGACKEAINKAASDALLAYRTHCASASSSGQLILPEALKLLPLYTLALSKASVFRTDSRPDVRAAAMWQLLSLPAHKAVPLVYARMVALHTLLERPENAMPVPDKLWLSAEKLDPTGVFMLENGQEAFIYVGKAVPSATLEALFGFRSLEGLDPQRPLTLPTLDTPLNKKVHGLLNEIRGQRTSYLRLRVVRRGDPLEQAFYNSLIEDRSPSAGMSYVEYLCYLHRAIQNKLA